MYEKFVDHCRAEGDIPCLLSSFSSRPAGKRSAMTALRSFVFAIRGGIANVLFDRDALTPGKLKTQAVRLRFADGTLIDSDVADILPPAS